MFDLCIAHVKHDVKKIKFVIAFETFGELIQTKLSWLWKVLKVLRWLDCSCTLQKTSGQAACEDEEKTVRET